MGVPDSCHLFLKGGLCQNKAGRNLVFRVGGRHRIKQGQTLFFVSGSVGQKGSGQSFALTGQCAKAPQSFAELQAQHPGGLFLVQMGMAVGRKIGIGQPAPQSLFLREGHPFRIQQQPVFQRKLHRTAGNAPGADIVRLRREQVLAASHNGPQAGKGFCIVLEQAFHVQTADESASSAHVDSGHTKGNQSQTIGPAYPFTAVAKHGHDLIPAQSGGVCPRDALPRLIRFSGKGRKHRELCLCHIQQRAVDAARPVGVPGRQ